MWGNTDSVYSTGMGGELGRGRTSLHSASTAALGTVLLKQKAQRWGESASLSRHALPVSPAELVPAYLGPLPPELVGGPTTARCSGGHKAPGGPQADVLAEGPEWGEADGSPEQSGDKTLSMGRPGSWDPVRCGFSSGGWGHACLPWAPLKQELLALSM